MNPCEHQWTDYGMLKSGDSPSIEIEACARCGVQRKKQRPAVSQRPDATANYHGIWIQTNRAGYKAADAKGQVCGKFNDPLKNNAWVYFVWEAEHLAASQQPSGSSRENAGEQANVHIEHYFPKGYDPTGEPWKSIKAHHAAERLKTEAQSAVAHAAIKCQHEAEQQLADVTKSERELIEICGRQANELAAERRARLFAEHDLIAKFDEKLAVERKRFNDLDSITHNKIEKLQKQLLAERDKREEAEVLSRGRMQQIERHQQKLIEVRQQLAAVESNRDYWIGEAKARGDDRDKLRQQLAAEREQTKEWSTLAVQKAARIIEIETQLLAAQAAIAELPKRYAEHLEAAVKAGELGDVDEKYQVDLLRAVISDIDLSALDKLKEELRKPLVDALELILTRVTRTNPTQYSHRDIEEWCNDALAKIKK